MPLKAFIPKWFGIYGTVKIALYCHEMLIISVDVSIDRRTADNVLWCA